MRGFHTWALLVVTLAAGGSAALQGCAATSDDDGGAVESEVRLGRMPDAAVDAQSEATAPDASLGSDASDASAPDGGSGPPGPVTTTFGTKLAAIGLDVNNLPSLHDLPLGQKMKVMRTFNEAMNITCDGCHVSDFAAPTRQKTIATEAWEVITRKLARADGSALYCDSCHQGTFHFLDRSDYSAIPAWMKTNFVDALKQKNGEAMSCATCHGDHVPGAPTSSTH